ncbi:phycobilisome rod-core linker polypeptide [Leptolyngbya sp. FACHB-261]|uniref:phycobilisome rod-core linker polypeptide n=1 Tax=Leptolyngbya sp. FACHB-261 TaxID=2692806 RepID=UPI001686DFBC|nr:phycobilisome rod-core linker polypeptide [Leptolyngbya sp. FACHB-261]MBD2104512.1 phycobilisome rod-core linker polypeptide [Leptolyngbya sp. FACHB-261]
MSLPLLNYKPASRNHRVAGYEVANEETPRTYRKEDVTSATDFDELIWAAYRQIFSEHLILQSSRQTFLESQLRNGAVSVRDFIRGLGKSEVFYQLVVEANNNYRLVDICLKRFLGRDAYNKGEEISWSIYIAENGIGGFVDALVDSEEYEQNFGENTVPYQRRRYGQRPYNLVTPRYGDQWREKLDRERPRTGDVKNFLEMARELKPKGTTFNKVSVQNIQVPSTSRETQAQTGKNINSSFSFPL